MERNEARRSVVARALTREASRLLCAVARAPVRMRLLVQPACVVAAAQACAARETHERRCRDRGDARPHGLRRLAARPCGPAGCQPRCDIRRTFQYSGTHRTHPLECSAFAAVAALGT